MRERIALETLRDIRDQTSYDIERRDLDRQRMRAQQQQPSMGGGFPAGSTSPMAEFSQGLSNLEYLAMWHKLTPQEQQRFMMQIQQMMSNPYQQNAFMGMMPYMMMQ